MKEIFSQSWEVGSFVCGKALEVTYPKGAQFLTAEIVNGHLIFWYVAEAKEEEVKSEHVYCLTIASKLPEVKDRSLYYVSTVIHNNVGYRIFCTGK